MPNLSDCENKYSVVMSGTNLEFVHIFKPFYYIDTIFFTQNYNIKNNQVLPVSKHNILFLVLINILLIILFCVTFTNDYFVSNSSRKVYFWVYIIYVIVFALTSIVNMCHYKTVLVLLIHLEKLKEYTLSPGDSLRMKIMTRVSSLTLIMFYFFIILERIFLHKGWFWPRFIFISVAVILEMKLLNVACLIHFLTRKIDKWVDFTLSCASVESPNQMILDDFKSTFQMIVSVYDLINRSFKIFILLHFSMSFVQLLLYIGIIIDSFERSQVEFTALRSVIAILAWFLKRWMVQIFLCSAFEMFYCKIEATRVKVIDKYYCDNRKGLKEFAKAIVRIIDVNFKKLNICGMFSVDMEVPLAFWYLAANYTIVLLQFSLDV